MQAIDVNGNLYPVTESVDTINKPKPSAAGRREEILKECIALHCKKVKEYKNTDDDFENFTEGANFNKCTREQTLWGYVTKHLVSVSSIIRTGKNLSKIKEKALDIIIYMVILIDMMEGGSDGCI